MTIAPWWGRERAQRYRPPPNPQPRFEGIFVGGSQARVVTNSTKFRCVFAAPIPYYEGYVQPRPQ